MEFLIKEYSWQGAVWIVSAIVLNCVPLGVLLKPINTLEKGGKFNETGNNKKKPIQTFNTDNSVVQAVLQELKLFKSTCFVTYGASCFLCALGFYIPFTFLPDFASDMGMTSQEGAILIAIIGIMNIVGRAVAGWLIDRPWMDPVKLNMGWLIIGGVATIFVPNYKNLIPMAIYCGLFGLTTAVFITCQPILSLELSDGVQMASFYGMVCFLQGVASLIGAPLAGMLADTKGDYSGSFYMAGVTVSIAGAVCLPLLCIKRGKWFQRQRAVDIENVVNVNNAIESTYL